MPKHNTKIKFFDNTSSRRGCANNPDLFCYVCGRFTKTKDRRNITPFIQNAYHAYFGVKLGDQDKYWAPHKVCITCVSTFSLWMKGKKHFSFGVPMVWREPQNHLNDCYFCAVRVTGLKSKTRSSIKYPSLPSAIQPVPHTDELPVPNFNSCQLSESDLASSSEESDRCE